MSLLDRISTTWEDFVHLTPRGRVSMIYYALRRLIVAPAPHGDRCFMGAPIGRHVWCPRRADRTGPWCRHHTPREHEANATKDRPKEAA